MRSPRGIVLTGASGGLGVALAAAFAGPGREMLLMGRDAARLAAARARAEARGAAVRTAAVPLEDTAALTAAIGAFEAETPIDLVIANAGVKCGNAEGIESPGETERVIAVNLTGSIATVQAALPGMQARRRGHIVVLSSLAGVSPQASLLSYSATKAGLRAYGIALRRRLRGTGVGVSVVVPGFIDTPMTDRHLGPTPAKLSAEAAAARILGGVRAGRATIAFPLALALLARLEALLPQRVGDRAALRLDARILSDDEDGTA